MQNNNKHRSSAEIRRPRSVLVSAALVVLSLLSSGCLTLGSAQTASTLGKGRVSGGVEASLVAETQPQWPPVANQGVGGFFSNGRGVPSVNGFIRFGVAERIDLGLRAGGSVLEVQSKFQLTSPDSQFVLSLAPALSGFYLPSVQVRETGGFTRNTATYGALVVPLPLLLGYKIKNHELVLGARVTNMLGFVRAPGSQTTTSGYALSLGGTLGIALRLGNAFIMMPELAISAPVYSTFVGSFGDGSSVSSGWVYFGGGISFQFGNFKPRIQAPEVKPETAAAAREAGEAQKASDLPPDVAPPPPGPTAAGTVDK